jgi:hypothetical protein
MQELLIWEIDPDSAEEVTPEVVLDALTKLSTFINKTDKGNIHGAAKALRLDL